MIESTTARSAFRTVAHDRYRRAIYVDFESLKKPPTPALLGILRDTDGETTFAQVILDERLAAARVARQQLRAGSIAEIVEELVASGLPLIGWSIFDRQLVVGDAAVPTELKQEWQRLYVNALKTARAWRTIVHPAFPISRAARFDPKHTLDQYAKLAGYPRLRFLERAKPATWIRHMADQLARRKYYRRVTQETKRDWHALLEYNRHDCEALRHVFTNAVSELEKWRQYEKTTYCVHAGAKRPICFRVGGRSVRLDALLERYGAARWAFITAWNPQSRQLPANENVARQNALLERLIAAGIRCLPGEGRGEDPTWPPEESILAFDIQPYVARALGRDFGQFAIVIGRRGRPARLVACS